LYNHHDHSKSLTFIATIRPSTQNKTKQLGWCGIIMAKKTTTTPPEPPHRTDYILSHCQATQEVDFWYAASS
jgi:hypothetical protein